jgi:hypothetical protein
MSPERAAATSIGAPTSSRWASWLYSRRQIPIRSPGENDLVVRNIISRLLLPLPRA